MTPDESQSLAVFLMVGLRAAGDAGRGEDRLLLDARREGFADLAAPDLQLQLRGLADKSWLAPYNSPLGGKRWRITARGESALAEQGL